MAVNIKKAKENLKKRHILREKQLDKLYAKAVSDFNAIVEMIINKYAPTKLVQWGSLLNRSYFKDFSDIDIAVEGITSTEKFFALVKDAETLTDLPLDIVQLEKIDPVHKKSIIKKGKVIYDHGKQSKRAHF